MVAESITALDERWPCQRHTVAKDGPVARYFFNITDGENIPDAVGSELADLASVRTEAVEAVIDLMKGRLLANSDTAAWIVQVTDEAGFTVMVLSLSASVHVLSGPLKLSDG